MKATESACRCEATGIVRPKACAGRPPRASLTTISTGTTAVVTVIPPAVDPLPPPMNMRASDRNHDSSRIAPTSMVVSPADRVLTDWNQAPRTGPVVSRAPSVPGLPHSNAPSSRVPPHSRTVEPSSVSLVCSAQREGARGERRRSRITGKPPPPTITASPIGAIIAVSEA